MRKHLISMLALGAGLLGGALPAQAKPVALVRGTIASISGEALDVTTASGGETTVMLTPKTPIAGVSYAKIGDIQPGSFIGTAAIPQPGGTWKALEVHVFAPSLRGTGEGSRPWDAYGGNSTMTNGTVGSLAGTRGRTLTVTYGGGQKQIRVPDDVPIVSVAPGTRKLLVPGAHVVAVVAHAAGSTVTAARVLVGRDGVVPPM